MKSLLIIVSLMLGVYSGMLKCNDFSGNNVMHRFNQSHHNIYMNNVCDKIQKRVFFQCRLSNI